MKVITGTPETRTEHSAIAAWLGLLVSVGAPMAIAVVGVLIEGIEAISWPSAIVWGLVATTVFTLASMMGKGLGVTKMDLLDLLGSAVAPPHTARSRLVGALIHHVIGAFLAVGWAYGAALLGVRPDWVSGLLWGVILWCLSLLLMSSIGAVHPAIRRGVEGDPGVAATNFGPLTPIGSLVGHIIYGTLLGRLYHVSPLG